MEVENRPNIQDQAERPGYKKTKLGWIPSDWETIKLGEIGEFKNGINKKKDDFWLWNTIYQFNGCFR